MSKFKTIAIAVTVILIGILMVIFVTAKKKQYAITKLQSMILSNDLVGVSQLITSYPELVNNNIESRTKLKPLALAASLGEPLICSNLLAAGASVNATDIVGQTPLHEAFNNLDTNVIAILLQHGASVTNEDSNGRTPLFRVSWWTNTSAVLMLLQHGANPNVKDNLGETPLDVAKRSKTSEEIINILSNAMLLSTNR